MKIKAGIQETYNQSVNPASYSLPNLVKAADYLNIPVGVITATVSLFPVLLSGAAIQMECHIFIFFSTVFIYNFDHSRISEADLINSPDRCIWYKERKVLIRRLNYALFSSCLLLLTCFLKPGILLIAFILLGVCLVYSLNVKVKRIPGVKSLIIAAVWSATCILLPAVWLGLEITVEIGLILSGCLTAAFINAVLFDIRDCKGDDAVGIKSLPAVLGVRRTMSVVIILSLTLIIFSVTVPLMYGFAGIGICYIIAATQKEAGSQSLLTDIVLLLAITGAYFQA